MLYFSSAVVELRSVININSLILIIDENVKMAKETIPLSFSIVKNFRRRQMQFIVLYAEGGNSVRGDVDTPLFYLVVMLEIHFFFFVIIMMPFLLFSFDRRATTPLLPLVIIDDALCGHNFIFPLNLSLSLSLSLLIYNVLVLSVWIWRFLTQSSWTFHVVWFDRGYGKDLPWMYM